MPHDPRAPGVVIPDDLTPWPGGDAAPADHDGGYVLMADGRWGLGNDLPGTWSASGHSLSVRGPVIAYRRLKPGAVPPAYKVAAIRKAALIQMLAGW